MRPKKPSPKFNDVESASLRLTFLKENSRYRKLIAENRDRVLSAYRELRSAVREGRVPQIPAVNRFGKEIPFKDMFKRFTGEGAILPLDGSPVVLIAGESPIAETHTWFHKRLEEDFGIVNPPFDVFWRTTDGRYDNLTADESFDLLDPMKDIESVPKERREAALRAMFSACGIRQVVHNDEEAGGFSEQASISVFELEQREKQQRRPEFITSGGTSPYFKGRLIPFPLSGLLPHERLLIVDLRKKKTKLLSEFRAFLDGVKHHRKQTKDSEWIKNYSRWKLDTTRTRAEAWRHLRIWKLRRMKKSFPEIARSMRMTEDLAKKSFYRAYELIEWEPYNPKRFHEAYRKFLKGNLLRTCADCSPSVRDDCGASGNLCPDVINFANQDYRPLREKPIPPEDADHIGSTDHRPARSTPRRKNE